MQVAVIRASVSLFDPCWCCWAGTLLQCRTAQPVLVLPRQHWKPHFCAAGRACVGLHACKVSTSSQAHLHATPLPHGLMVTCNAGCNSKGICALHAVDVTLCLCLCLVISGSMPLCPSCQTETELKVRALYSHNSAHRTVQSCTLNCSALRCADILYYTILYYMMLYYITLYYITLCMQDDSKQEEHGSCIYGVWQQHFRSGQVAVWALGAIVAAASLQQGCGSPSLHVSTQFPVWVPLDELSLWTVLHMYYQLLWSCRTCTYVLNTSASSTFVTV